MIKEPTCHYVKAPLFIFPLDGEFIVYNPLLKQTHLLNETSKKIWDLYDETMDAQKITSILVSEFKDIDYQSILSDVNSTIKYFKQQDLLVLSRDF